MDFSQSAKLYRQSCNTLATGVSSSMRMEVTPVPLFFERGEGAWFLDVDGNRLLDYTLGWGPLIVGNNHPFLNQQVAAQLERAYAFGAQHELEIRLSQQIVDCVPGIEQVIFSNSGSEAVQAALRIARAATGRDKVIKFAGHYHGWMNNMLVSYRPQGDDPRAVEPGCGGQPTNEYRDTIVLPWNDLDAVEETFQRRPGEIACVITEPILANSGSCMPREGFLQNLVDLCRRHGAMSVFDEVITGFRIALGGAREYFNVQPDLSIYGKAMAGGFAVSAVGGRRRSFTALVKGSTTHAGTYNGNPVNLAAAAAVLDILARPGTFAAMHAHGKAVMRTVEWAAADCGHPVAISGVGTVFSVHWNIKQQPRNYHETLLADTTACGTFREAMLQRGVLLLPDGRWYVGAAHGEEELAVVQAAIVESMNACI